MRVQPHLLIRWAVTALVILNSWPLTAASSDTKVFYVQFDVETENGQYTGSRMSMIPAEKDYRAEGFRCYTITGRSEKNPQRDAPSAASDNALTTLLMGHGLKSVSSKKRLFNLIAVDRTVMSYEGMIRYPYDVIHEGYIKGEETYEIKIKVWFSPVAFPDRWSYLYVKKKIKDIIGGWVSFFR